MNKPVLTEVQAHALETLKRMKRGEGVNNVRVSLVTDKLAKPHVFYDYGPFEALSISDDDFIKALYVGYTVTVNE